VGHGIGGVLSKATREGVVKAADGEFHAGIGELGWAALLSSESREKSSCPAETPDKKEVNCFACAS
jgi:hypothetical protein